MGTQRSAMGEYKKFCIALTTVGLPNLIAFDLVAVSPMSSITGNVAYIEYIKGTTKGESSEGDLVNSIWELGTPDPNYTGQAVVEVVAAGQTEPMFGPVRKGMINPADDVAYNYKVQNGDIITYTDTFPGKGAKVAYIYDNVIIPQETLPTLKAELKNIGLEAKARRIAVNMNAA